jgi:hypothetical protein
MLRIKLRTVSIALVLTAGAGLAHADADIYRWKDAQGIYHYSDQWVPGSELIKSSNKQRPTPVADSGNSSSASNSSVSDTPPADTPSPASAEAVKDDMAKIRAQQCKEATDAYNNALRARRLYKEGKDGQRTYISDAEIDAYRLQVRTEMDKVCKPAS